MSEKTAAVARANTAAQIMRTQIPRWPISAMPRICLTQLRAAELLGDETAAKRDELEWALHWDHEDYDEHTQGPRPENVDPQADVVVCGIGGCAVRVFQAQDGGEIQTGKCKASGYCLKDRFLAVGKAATQEDGRAIYSDVLETCDGLVGGGSAGNFCPQLACELSAGVSEDCIPGTAGVCMDDVTKP